MKRQVAGEQGVGRLLGDGGGLDGGGGKLRGIEEVGAFQMAGEAVGIGPNRIDLNDDFVAGVRQMAVGDFQFAGKCLEPAIVFAGDLRADEVDGGGVRADGVRTRVGGVGDLCGSGGIGGGRDVCGGNFVSGIGAAPE